MAYEQSMCNIIIIIVAIETAVRPLWPDTLVCFIRDFYHNSGYCEE